MSDSISILTLRSRSNWGDSDRATLSQGPTICQRSDDQVSRFRQSESQTDHRFNGNADRRSGPWIQTSKVQAPAVPTLNPTWGNYPKSTDFDSDDKRDEREEHRLRQGFGKSEAGVFPVAADEGQERVQGSPDGEEDEDLKNGFPSGNF
ncbi:hypothetical protein U1Q18_046893 [Sarracenia purpurea var. burkii]